MLPFLVPVDSHTALRAPVLPPEPVPDAGAVWGKASVFEILDPDEDPGTGPGAGPGAGVTNHFNSERSLSSRANFKLNRTAALAEWRGLCAE